MIRDFLPNMRGIVAHELSEEGESQRRVAQLLGITQARVSHYLSEEKETYYVRMAENFGTSTVELEGFGKALGKDVRRSQVDGIFTLYSIWKSLLFQGNACSIHRKRSAVSLDCSVCMSLHKANEAQRNERTMDEDYSLLQNLSDAISIVERSMVFPSIMPEVSVNIAYCRRNATSKSDVAAIPGRINKFHGRAKAFVLPEFGSSNHMSNVLLMFHAKSHKVRSVMNLKSDRDIEKALSKLDVPKYLTGGLDKRSKKPAVVNPDQFVLARLARIELRKNVRGDCRIPFTVVDRGFEGFEPITYIFGSTATELAELGVKISELYSNSKAVKD